MKENLIVIGASGHGKVVADIAIKMKKWKRVMFLDDDETIRSSAAFEIIGNVSNALEYSKTADFFVAIGKNCIREKIQEKLQTEGVTIATLIHPSAIIGTDVQIGVGSVVMAGVVINSSSQIGKGCIINTKSSLDHDNTICDYAHISPGVSLAGTVSIGKNTWLGIGSVVINNISICSDCIIGAGSVVVKDITEPGTYIGIPARRLD